MGISLLVIASKVKYAPIISPIKTQSSSLPESHVRTTLLSHDLFPSVSYAALRFRISEDNYSGLTPEYSKNLHYQCCLIDVQPFSDGVHQTSNIGISHSYCFDPIMKLSRFFPNSWIKCVKSGIKVVLNGNKLPAAKSYSYRCIFQRCM